MAWKDQKEKIKFIFRGEKFMNDEEKESKPAPTGNTGTKGK